jgi:long-chain acyl-CoA synthetase
VLSKRQEPGDIFLTGATGLLGMALLARIVERSDRRVWALVRAEDDDEAAARLRTSLASVVADPDAAAEQVRAVAGDLTTPALGIDPARREELAESVTHVLHSAASVSFALPLAEARAINVEGTRRVLDFAGLCADRGGGLRRYSHVSTAYVAGTHSGVFHEQDLDVGQEFNNTYERSKWEAERLVRSRSDELPAQVLRPSIVVGEEDGGWTASFNVIYLPLRALAAGALPFLPARRSAPVDAVSVSYVADAILALSGEEHEDRTYHLTAGDATSTVGELIDLSTAKLERRRPLVVPPAFYRRVVHPLALRLTRGSKRRWLARSHVFFPYFATQVRFDASRTQSALASARLRPRPLSSYFEGLLDFAVASEWGRRPVSRPQARSAAGCDGGRGAAPPSERARPAAESLTVQT